MATDFKQLRNEFFEKLLDILKPLGFRFLKGETKYMRKTEIGLDIIDLTWVSYPSISFVFKMGIGVRHEGIEAMYADYFDIDRRYAYTVGNRFENMFRSFEFQWEISNREEMEMAVFNMMNTIENIAFPYFERFSTLEAIADILWRDDDEAKRMNLSERAPFMGLSAAYLLNRRDKFDELADKLDKKLESRPEELKYFADFYSRYFRFLDDMKKKWKELK